jgi:hypothetical protein
MTDDITPSKLHRLRVTGDKYDYVMAMAGCCQRLGYSYGCGCKDECSIIKMHTKWADDGNR